MPTRVGVIGAGVMGADHIRNLSTTISGAEVTFVADLDAVVIASHDSASIQAMSPLALGPAITEVSWQAGRSSLSSAGTLLHK